MPLLFALPHSASAVDWFPIVPCGLNAEPVGATRQDLDANGKPIGVHKYMQPCNQCLLIELGKNVIDMTAFAIVPAVGTLMFMIAGFIILFNARSGNANGVGKGKEIMTNTAIGIAIILGAWLITNFILKSIANPQVANVPWYQIQCNTNGIGGILGVKLSTGTGNNGDTGQKYTCTNNQCVKNSSGKYTTVTCDGVCPPPDGTKLYTCSNNQCIEKSDGEYDDAGCYGACGGGSTPSGPGTQCGDMSAVCSTSSCKPFINDPLLPAGKTDWTYLIPSVASQHQIDGIDTASFLEAIIRIESQGKVARQSNSSPPSCGLTQMQAGTANMFRQNCGVTHDVTCDWLQGKALQAGETAETVAKASICMTAEYAKSIVNSRCYGGQARDLAAGYNGGDGCNATIDRDNALALSRTCNSSSTATNKNETDCSGRPTLRYECVYNDLAHTTCNTGFVETRNYVQQFNACYQ